MTPTDIKAILADPTWRRGFEERLRESPAESLVELQAEHNLARMRAAQRRGQLRWKGVSTKERSRLMKAARAKGGGMPRSAKPRCWCGKYTVDTATSRRFDCCKRAGVYPAVKA